MNSPTDYNKAEMDAWVLQFILGVLREQDLLNGQVPYEVYAGWPDWYSQAYHAVQGLWLDMRRQGLTSHSLRAQTPQKTERPKY